jgi:hypothetical protein
MLLTSGAALVDQLQQLLAPVSGADAEAEIDDLPAHHQIITTAARRGSLYIKLHDRWCKNMLQ